MANDLRLFGGRALVGFVGAWFQHIAYAPVRVECEVSVESGY